MDFRTSLTANRRDWLQWTSGGLLTAALTTLLGKTRPVLADRIAAEASDPPPHFPAKAKCVIHICCCGGISQVDSFDYKPELEKFHGKNLPGDKPEVFFGQVGLLRQSDFEFKQRGESGLRISELFPNIATVADDLTVIRSMTADSASHTPATMQENSGFRLNGFPTMGAWMSYGLGCETDELPAFVVLPDARGLPASGTNNWTSGFLPPTHQGVMFQTQGDPIRDLKPKRSLSDELERDTRELQKLLNKSDLVGYEGDADLKARMKAYELAAKMQLAVPQIIDLSNETAGTTADYGLDQPDTAEFGKACLLARRLAASGVRFIQVYSGGAFGSPRINWDGHENCAENHSQEAKRIDRPVAALIRDLKQRGMLDETLVLITSEFGRTPFAQSAADQVGPGRDHNPQGFTVLTAGGGTKPGFAFGATDDLGWKAVDNVLTWPDFHATVLHQLGIDHTRLTYYHNGILRRLTNVHGHVVKGILA